MTERTPLVNESAVVATVRANRVGQPITKYVYGQFIEHLGNLINHGLWSELLDDRKFYHPITTQEEEQEAAGPMRMRANKWRPIGPEDAVAMDATRAYASDHAPRVQAIAGQARGIRQAGLALRRKGYTGRIVLAAEGIGSVEVALAWGASSDQREVIRITPGAEYATYPLAFAAGGDTDDGSIEITATGEGAFWVGAVSLMPADNVQGFRADVVALLKQLNSGIYRFPGGNFLSNHDWRDAIGDPDRRPPTWDYAWNVAQPNDVGTDELVALCRLLDVEPYISVNAGFGEARSAADLVEYCNGSADTPMGALRAANGHPEPYGVTWWGVGNEAYGWWELGYIALDQFIIKHKMFVRAMRKKDPSIKIIASGCSVDEMTCTINARRVTGKVVAEFGSEADWSGGLLTHCLDDIDVMSEHYYCHDGKRFDIETAGIVYPGTYAGYIEVEETPIEWARRPANRIRTKVESYEEYYARIPGLGNKFVPLNIDEWAYARVGPNLKQAVSYAWMFQEMFRHTDLITMAAYTFATSCVTWNGAESILNTSGLLFKLYRDHFGTLPVEVDGNSPQPEPMYPVGGDQPKVNAGSPTYPLDVAAAWTADRKALTIGVVNPTEEEQTIGVRVEGASLGSGGRMWRLAGPDAQASIELGKEPRVSVVEEVLAGAPERLVAPPMSVTIYVIPAE